MAVKYEIEYYDVESILHKIEILDDDYTDPIIEVGGYAVLDYGEVGLNLESIRGQGLRVNLDADVNLTFEELFTANEKTFKVNYYRNSVLLFQGWLNPEGFYEDYVSDKWVISFDCIDGLGYLKDLAFVNTNGSNITGIKSQLEILSLALQRTGIEQNINVAINIFYTGLADTVSILANVKANTQRYIKDDDFTVMSCEDVIKDVLETYGAVLISKDNEWYIYKPNELFSSGSVTYFRYDYLGVALSPTTATLDTSLTIGSQINDFYPHHCNGNQSFTNDPSYGAYRISYKYGQFTPLTQNEFLEVSGGVYPSWSILILPPPYYFTIPPNGEQGAIFDIDNTTPNANIQPILESDGDVLDAGVLLTITTSATVSTPGISAPDRGRASISLKLEPTDLSADLYLDRNTGLWGTTNTGALYAFYSTGENSAVLEVTDPTPKAGRVRLLYDVPRGEQPTPPTYNIKLTQLSVSFLKEAGNIKGDIWTFSRTTKPSAKVAETKEVFTGDDNQDIFLGTLYKADGVTPTETWYRKGVTEEVKIVQLMGSDTMRMNANTIKIYSGDIYGYFSYFSLISIDQRDGKYGVTKYSYNTKENIISAEFRQLHGAELDDLDIKENPDYGNVVKPTIKG